MSDELLARLIEAMEQGESVALLTIVNATGVYSSTVGNHCLVWQQPHGQIFGDLELPVFADHVLADVAEALNSHQHQRKSYADERGSVQVFIEVQKRPSRLIIVGAGHIAVPLAQMASICDFHVTVLDDRRKYANRERFPDADDVISGPLTDELRKIRADGAGYDNDTYVVLVTRGHQHDIESLVELIDDPLAYIGMIGSPRRIRAVFELLESEQGIPRERLNNVYAPIGIDIGAHTPAEIAVCIMAEIINVMRGGPALSYSDQVHDRRRNETRTRARTSISQST